MAQIAELLDILAKPERVLAIIDDELKQVIGEYGEKAKDVRRSEIELNASDLETEDLSKYARGINLIKAGKRRERIAAMRNY